MDYKGFRVLRFTILLRIQNTSAYLVIWLQIHEAMLVDLYIHRVCYKYCSCLLCVHTSVNMCSYLWNYLINDFLTAVLLNESPYPMILEAWELYGRTKGSLHIQAHILKVFLSFFTFLNVSYSVSSTCSGCEEAWASLLQLALLTYLPLLTSVHSLSVLDVDVLMFPQLFL